MKFRYPLIFASISLASAASGPLTLKFASGETLKYLSTISATEKSSFKGETFEIKVTGSNTMWDPLESTCRHASLSIL